MCRFITAVVPADIDQDSLRPILDKYGMYFKEVNNPFVNEQLGGEVLVKATRSICECDTALGAGSRLKETDQTGLTHSHEIDKLRKKGWSQHKIERWLVEKSNSAERRLTIETDKYDAELAQWCEFITLVLSNGIAKRLGLLLHMYNGNLEEEQIRIKRFERLTVTESLCNDLLTMDEDVLYTVSKS